MSQEWIGNKGMGADKREKLKRKKDKFCNSSHRLPAFVRGIVDQGRRVTGAQVKSLFAVVSVIASLGSGERERPINSYIGYQITIV